MNIIGIQSPGDMGSGVGGLLRRRGFQVLTALGGRSERSRALARQAGMEDVGTLDELVARAGLVLSIVPPAAALETARAFAGAMERTGRRPAFADCNAVSPATVQRIARILAPHTETVIDAGIIGLAPGRSPLPTRFYASGPDTAPLEAIGGSVEGGGPGEGIVVRPLGEAIGLASGIKMAYAAITKGTMTLHTAALLAGERLGVGEALRAELAESQGPAFARMQHMVPRLPLDAGRWVGEMHEIAGTFERAGLPGDFHRGAARVFELLARTPIAAETRENVDESRTLEEALAVYLRTLEDLEEDSGAP